MKDEIRSFHRLKALTFFATPSHPCGYLAERSAVSLVADPRAPMTDEKHALLAAMGFRRSGEYLYRPHCPACRACIPVRIPVAEFRPNRSQRRTWQRNQDLEVRVRPLAFDPEHFRLYRRYVGTRHAGGSMDTPDPEDYRRFISSPWSDSALYEFRLGEHLAAVAVVDYLPDALSAVYTFFDPVLASRSLGTFAVLRQIQAARDRGLPWLYLGYWIRESPKMAYKAHFRPLQYFDGSRWATLQEPA